MEYPKIFVDGQEVTMDAPKARLYVTFRKYQKEAEAGDLDAYAEIVAAAFKSKKADITADWILDNLGGGELIAVAIQIMRVVNETVEKEFDRFPEIKNALTRV